MTETDLRDHAEELLTAIAEDVNVDQTPEEQGRKARGLGAAAAMLASGRLHADGRIGHGFTLGQVMAEFRALRASVLRLYELTGSGDLSGVRRFNESIDEALTESVTRYAAQTDLYRDQFIGILSHDLRSPLSAITAGAALLSSSADARQSRAAGRILNSAQRMGRMIGDSLDLTRARLGGTIPLNRTTTNLQELCDEVTLEVQSGTEGATVRCGSSGNVQGQWDADRLAQVVSNLVGNAVQHGDGGPVTLNAYDAGARVRLTVHNTGEPIPVGAQRSLFEPLVRRAAGGADSIGLGLFIAKAIVLAHGGDIGVTSGEGAGTTFEVLLPRESSTDETLARPIDLSDDELLLLATVAPRSLAWFSRTPAGDWVCGLSR